MTESHNEPHIGPKTYYVIFGLLMILLVATVGAAEFDFGRMNIVIALAIAGAKATLILLYFMHLRYSIGLVQAIAISGFLFLSLLIVVTMADVLARPQVHGWP